ncbi:unnamed protein product [Schistocephalus solidus]|uniref:Ataxin-1 n=1 Tax=Schistocephalus solidus TaxID=70667 RepID=A0A183TLR6_SCHSO|nr:unnamed protein product [Schistocephalus solidus]
MVEVAAPSQLHLPQHGMEAEDAGPLQDFRYQDPVLPSQLQCSAEAAEMKVIQLPGLVRVDGPGFRSVKECRQDDSLVHLQFGVQSKVSADFGEEVRATLHVLLRHCVKGAVIHEEQVMDCTQHTLD